jgi:hypothetical protein
LRSNFFGLSAPGGFFVEAAGMVRIAASLPPRFRLAIRGSPFAKATVLGSTARELMQKSRE